jgi:hypothetical protein
VILALDLGQHTSWAVRNRDGAIASGTHEFRPGRFEGGGMVWLRFRTWLQEVDETSGGICVVVLESKAPPRHDRRSSLRRIPCSPHSLGGGEQSVSGCPGRHDQASRHRRATPTRLQ